MRGKKVTVIKVDEDHKLYFFKNKVVYKERKNGKLVTKVVSAYLSDLLESNLIADDVKGRIRDLLKSLS